MCEPCAVAVSISALAQEVREDWQRQGLRVVTVDVNEIPAQLRERLPGDFITFLTVAGLPDDSDSRFISFWQPKEWEEVDGRLVFADFLINSHAYALLLSGPDRGRVCVLFDTPEPPIGTFAEFLRAYLDDDPRLQSAFTRNG
jgi:hypothetical protein